MHESNKVNRSSTVVEFLRIKSRKQTSVKSGKILKLFFFVLNHYFFHWFTKKPFGSNESKSGPGEVLALVLCRWTLHHPQNLCPLLSNPTASSFSYLACSGLMLFGQRRRLGLPLHCVCGFATIPLALAHIH